MTPFEALHGRECRTPLCLAKIYDKRIVGPDMSWEIKEKVKLICERLKAGSNR